MNTSAFGVEKGTLIKVPATANLMVDSADRNELIINGTDVSTPYNFTMARNQALISGFFTRIGTTEVVVEYCADNISETLNNNSISFDVSGIGVISVTIPSATYTVAGVLDAIVEAVDDVSGSHSGAICRVIQQGGQTFLEFLVGGVFREAELADPTQKLVEQLDILESPVGDFLINCPDLRPYRYWDFVCENLTQVQDVKDASTAPIVRDVLCRWYFSFDDPPQLDAYGFPILMGYTRFCLRRIFNPPKQIKWEQNIQVGNLVFSVYGDDQELVSATGGSDTNWLMTLQLTEG